MSDSKGQYQKFPPGWDCKYDQATGNCYYINYLTKAMQLEDPRIRYKQLQNERCSTESIPMQPVHGSPYHVYPSNNLPAMRAAFQTGPATNPSLQNVSSSPLFSSRGHLEMSPLPYPKSSLMQTPRLAHMSRRSTIQETSFSNQIDTDAVVTKIQNMFPTASEDHIRLLLKRYYNREAVVISALQVEKHPVTMPGPFVTPPSQRHLYHSNSAFLMTPPARRPDIGADRHAHGLLYGTGSNSSRTASPIPIPGNGRFGSVISMHSGIGRGGIVGVGLGADTGFGCTALPFYHHGSPHYGEQWRSSPKPHSSPKMKLRYMKTIFPKADEMLLLDILANADNNVQKASEQLISMGYAKRESVQPPKISNRPPFDGMHRQPGDEKIIPLRPKEYTHEEKETMHKFLKEKYPQIAERIILMALESVNYAEDRAIQILQIVQEDDETLAKKHTTELETTLELDEETLTDGATVDAHGADAGENIITVVLETAQTQNENNNSNMDEHIQASSASSSTSTITAKKQRLPSINVTTPTTATTQIILSNSPICIENENETTETKVIQSCSASIKNTIELKPTSKTQTSSSLNTTTKKDTIIFNSCISSTLEKPTLSSTPSSTSTPSSSSYQTITTKNILAHSNSNAIGVNGYLHGSAFTATNSAYILEKLKLSRLRDKSDSLKNSQRGSTEDDGDNSQQQEFKSLLGCIATLGHNAELSKGPDENLLLADYVTWNGANPEISMHHKQIVAGADTNIKNERSYTPVGRNPELCKGPKATLAKGSIYAQLSVGSAKSNNIMCN